MARIATDQSTVLTAVVTRLIGQVAALNAANCYLSCEPDPTVERSHHLFVQVSPGDGRFDDAAHTGGGINQVFEVASVWVTIFVRTQLDQVQRSTKTLQDASRGLLTLKKSILKALSGHDLQSAGGDNIVINYMAPMSAARPLRESWEGFAVQALQFSTDFEWDLLS